MKYILFALVLFISTAMADVHVGLKRAIDNKDIKKASAIIQNLGVQDVYCPATLSVVNGKKLYGKRFSESPELLLTNCEEGFIQAYSATACSDKSSVELCKRVLDGKDVSEWFGLLKSIRKNKLDQVSEEYEEEVEAKGRRSQSDCEMEISTKYDEYCCEMSDDDYGDYMKLVKKCMNDGGVVKKKVKKTRTVNLFLEHFKKFSTYTTQRAMSLVGFTKEDSEKIAFVKSLAPTDNVQDLMMKISMDSYRDSSYVNDMLILAGCRFFPNFDKQIEKKIGFQMFTCKAALNAYSEKNVPACGKDSDNVIFTTKPLMEDAPFYRFSCTGGVWSVASKTQLSAQEKTGLSEATRVLGKESSEKTLLKIRTQPTEADVYINGKLAKRKTPFGYKVASGNYDILISKDGFLANDTTLVVKEGTKEIVLNVKLTAINR